MRRLLPAVLLCLATPALAQDDDGGGLIERFLERNLSETGRDVTITGFEGALSRRATMTQLTIADEDGVWLTLEGAVFDWNRAALLRGNLTVQELTAERLEISRRPVPTPPPPGADAPRPEASGFRLPELPISISIGDLGIDEIALAEPVLGESVRLSLSGALTLADGTGEIIATLDRLDRPGDRVVLDAGFDNATRDLGVTLTAREAQGGLAGTLLGLPGAPSLAFGVQGSGPLDDFTADIGLTSNGDQRLSGQVALRGGPDETLDITAGLSGDLTPLMQPDYRPFFGPDSALSLTATRAADGAFEVEELSLSTRALQVDGRLSLAADGAPTFALLTGEIAAQEGGPVTLPSGQPPLRIAGARFDARFDAAASDRWILDARVDGIARDGVRVETVSLDGNGTISGDGTGVTGTLDFTAEGVDPGTPDLRAALGTALRGRVGFAAGGGAPFELTGLTLAGDDYGLEVSGDVIIAERTLQVDGSGRLAAEDLSRFSGLAGRPLTGAAEIAVSGQADVLGGLFDAEVDLRGTGLSVGQETADRLLDGPVTLSAAARRDTTGITLERFALDSPGLTAEGGGKLGGGESDLSLTATLADIGLVAPQYSGPLSVTGTVGEPQPDRYGVDLSLDGPYALSGTVAGVIAGGDSDLTLDLSLPDIAPLVPETGHAGPLAVRGTAAQTGEGRWRVDLDLDTPYDGTAALDGTVGDGRSALSLAARLPDIAPLAPGFSGAVTVEGTAEETPQGPWQVDLAADTPFDGTLTLAGPVDAQGTRLAYTARLPDLSPLVPALPGALDARGVAEQTAQGWRLTAVTTAPLRADAEIDARLADGPVAADIALRVPDLAPIAPGLPGGASVTGAVTQAGAGWDVALDAAGPWSATARVAGTVAPDIDLDVSARLPELSRIVPALPGPVAVDGTLQRRGDGPFDIGADLDGPLGGSGRIAGRFDPGASAFDVDFTLPSLAPLAPGLGGPVSVEGRVAEGAGGWGVDLATRGPGAAATRVTGTVAADFGTVALDATGTVPLGLANPFLGGNEIFGTADLALSVQGPPGLSALSGRVSVDGARLALPQLRQTLTGIAARIDLAGGAATLDLSAQSPQGGTVSASGRVDLTSLDGDLALGLDGFVLEQPALYRTTLDGRLAMTGPLAGGARIAGRIDVGTTEIRIPDTGFGFGATIPDITHVAEPDPSYIARLRAGLVEDTDESETGGGGPAYPLAIEVDAPNGIFLRGRGLDAELGGTLRIDGTTAAPIPSGRISVIRGRLDILGKRLELSADSGIALSGDLAPTLDLVASSEAEDLTVLIAITGQIDSPEFTFSSSPQLPEDEVLARFLFDRGIANLSALQAARLAASIATLTGRGGGGGLLSGLREGLGVDDLDIATGADGETEVRVGKYLSENIYTDVTTDSGGGTEIDLNIDLTDDVTVRGRATDEGRTSLGIYFERDY